MTPSPVFSLRSRQGLWCNAFFTQASSVWHCLKTWDSFNEEKKVSRFNFYCVLDSLRASFEVQTPFVRNCCCHTYIATLRFPHTHSTSASVTTRPLHHGPHWELDTSLELRLKPLLQSRAVKYIAANEPPVLWLLHSIHLINGKHWWQLVGGLFTQM